MKKIATIFLFLLAFACSGQSLINPYRFSTADFSNHSMRMSNTGYVSLPDQIAAADSRVVIMDFNNYTLGADAIHYTSIANTFMAWDFFTAALKQLGLYSKK